MDHKEDKRELHFRKLRKGAVLGREYNENNLYSEGYIVMT